MCIIYESFTRGVINISIDHNMLELQYIASTTVLLRVERISGRKIELQSRMQKSMDETLIVRCTKNQN